MATAARSSKVMIFFGWILGILPAGLLLFSSSMKLLQKPNAAMFEHIGWQPRMAVPLGILEASCAIIYLIPRTAVLGAILISGYLGGAIATHVRIGEGPYIQILAAMLPWFGLYLRDSRIRSLLPLRS